MIGKAGLAMLALLATGQSSGTSGEGPIRLSFGHDANLQGNTLEFRIVPSGRMTLDTVWREPIDKTAPPVSQNLKLDVGFTGYRRIAALVAPLRRWKGSVPCDRPAPVPGSPFGIETDVFLTIRWEADGTVLKVPITCGFGPAENDIELGRAAFEQVRAWGRPDSGFTEDGPGNMAANAIEQDVTD
jgi:hypothetical protein